MNTCLCLMLWLRRTLLSHLFCMPWDHQVAQNQVAPCNLILGDMNHAQKIKLHRMVCGSKRHKKSSCTVQLDLGGSICPFSTFRMGGPEKISMPESTTSNLPLFFSWFRFRETENCKIHNQVARKN